MSAATMVFDIETGPLPLAQLEAAMPEFDPSEVKVGNLKDPALIAAKIEAAKVNQRRQFVERAALDPTTGKVLAIGMMDGQTGQSVILADDEQVMLNQFWDSIRDSQGTILRMCGFNCNLFDLPFLVRRSWHLGIPIPTGLRNGRYWNDRIIDLRDVWQLGDRTAHGSLDRICKFLGLGEKLGDGKDFAALLASDRSQAMAYLEQDLNLARKLARRLGVI